MIKNKKRGFTLIELMAAVAITLLVITGSLLSFVQLMFLADSSVNLTVAASHAQYVLEQLRGTAYGAISGYSLPALSVLFDENLLLPSETIALIPPPVVGANLATITVDVGWKEKNQDKHFILSTCIAK